MLPAHVPRWQGLGRTPGTPFVFVRSQRPLAARRPLQVSSSSSPKALRLDRGAPQSGLCATLRNRAPLEQQPDCGWEPPGMLSWHPFRPFPATANWS